MANVDLRSQNRNNQSKAERVAAARIRYSDLGEKGDSLVLFDVPEGAIIVDAYADVVTGFSGANVSSPLLQVGQSLDESSTGTVQGNLLGGATGLGIGSADTDIATGGTSAFGGVGYSSSIRRIRARIDWTGTGTPTAGEAYVAVRFLEPDRTDEANLSTIQAL